MCLGLFRFKVRSDSRYGGFDAIGLHDPVFRTARGATRVTRVTRFVVL